MDKIEKALKKLSAKEKSEIKSVFLKLNSGKVRGLDIKKLKLRDDIFRVRKGNLRVLYRVENKAIFILSVDRRRESTYKL